MLAAFCFDFYAISAILPLGLFPLAWLLARALSAKDPLSWVFDPISLHTYGFYSLLGCAIRAWQRLGWSKLFAAVATIGAGIGLAGIILGIIRLVLQTQKKPMTIPLLDDKFLRKLGMWYVIAAHVAAILEAHR